MGVESLAEVWEGFRCREEVGDVRAAEGEPRAHVVARAEAAERWRQRWGPTGGHAAGLGCSKAVRHSKAEWAPTWGSPGGRTWGSEWGAVAPSTTSLGRA